MRALQRALGMTVLFSAHELNPLLGALDRVLYLGSGQAALGTVDEVITGPVLSRLYGTEIEVVRAAAGASSSWPAAGIERRIGDEHGHRRMFAL